MDHSRSSLNFLITLLAGALFCLPSRLPAQEVKIDTSDYLPLFYSGALEYNLMTAASKGYTTEISRMIGQGAEIDAKTAEGVTPLVFAIAHFQINAVELLLELGADPNIQTSISETPLLIAIKTRQSPEYLTYTPESEHIIDSLEMLIVETLIRHGADKDFQDVHGVTPLNYASIHGYIDFVDLLVYYGAELDKKSYDGTTPLMSAVWTGYDDVAELLIQNGANLESRDAGGITPFLIAAQNGDTLMLDMLLKNGVDIYEKDNNNWDALDISIKSGQKDAVEWLLWKGNKWNDPGREIINYYNVAANYSRKEIMGLLEKNNFHSGYKPHFNQMDLALSSKFNLWDIYTGFNFAFKEPLKNIGMIAGFDTKLWYTRVLVKESSTIYYQYMDKSSLAYAGVFKDFKLTDNLFKSNIYFSPSISGAYFFGNKFKGTDRSPASKFKVIPGITFKFEKKDYSFSTGIEVMTSDFSRIWPIWIRIGFSHKFFFDSGRSISKNIKWY